MSKGRVVAAPLVAPHLVCGCLFVAVGNIFSWWVASCSGVSFPGWERSPICRLVREWHQGMEELVYQVAPIFFVSCFMYPSAQGAILVNLEGGDIVEEEA